MSYPDKAVLILSVIWGLSELVIMFFSRKNEKKKRDKISSVLLIIWLSLSVGIFISIFARIYKIGFLYSTGYLLPSIGMVFVLTGIAVRWTAFLTLKGYFTGEVVIQDNHKLVDYGNYRYIRHPAYSGAILTFFGLGLSYANWLSFLILFLPYTVAILNKIKYEEEILETHFGWEYLNYRNKTRKIIPFIY